jgi:hypothetical protein
MTKKSFTDAFVLGVADSPQSDGSGSPDGFREGQAEIGLGTAQSACPTR